ncbi:MAG: PD40 domain-containing protein [Planctomycetes bacterium]|nr:PD40 domain-containing protein [Planctomycetota bacterium]
MTGTTEAVSVDSAGVPVQVGGWGLCISDDGQFVAFETADSDIVPGDTNWYPDIFVRDRQMGTNDRVSLAFDGAQGDGGCYYPAISNGGRFVAYESVATNLVPGDTNGKEDVFVRDRLLGTTERVSISSSGAQGNGDSRLASISGDGRFVAFQSTATTFVPGDTNGRLDSFLHDRLTGITQRISVATDGSQGDADSGFPLVSADGRFVAFSSSASNLVPGFSGGYDLAYLRDLNLGTTQLVSIAQDGSQADYVSYACGLSANGRYVCILSAATNLVPIPTPNQGETYVRDMRTGQTSVASTRSDGSYSNGAGSKSSISADGRFVVFESYATDYGPTDTNGTSDVFVKDLLATDFTSLCDPAQGNVIACPCGNPPSGTGRGCDNSSQTGGAILSAAGNSYVSQDSLVFTSLYEKANATSLLLQGTALIPNGAVFGQGVRCAGGTLKRLYVKTATGGMMTAPDFGLGDPTISARSAQLGVPIDCGVPHYYFVYYRDPIVLGGCPAASTFNATQTGSIQWWP